MVLISVFEGVMTRTTRSRFDHEVGGTVEGCTILDKRNVIPPDPAQGRRGVYEYLLEAAEGDEVGLAAAKSYASDESPEVGFFASKTGPGTWIFYSLHTRSEGRRGPSSSFTMSASGTEPPSTPEPVMTLGDFECHPAATAWAIS
jgi:hypothetical protein